MLDNGKEAGTSLPTVFDYREKNKVAFKLHDGSVAVNATEMGKCFGKQPKDWLRTDQAKDYINAVVDFKGAEMPFGSKSITYDDVVKTVRGTDHPGTWMHEDVALEFARWLNPTFAIWTNRHIKELMRTGQTSTGSNGIDAETVANEGHIHRVTVLGHHPLVCRQDGRVWVSVRSLSRLMGYAKAGISDGAVVNRAGSGHWRQMAHEGNQVMMVDSAGLRGILANASSYNQMTASDCREVFRVIFKETEGGLAITGGFDYAMTRKQMTDIIKVLTKVPVNKTAVMAMLLDTEIA